MASLAQQEKHDPATMLQWFTGKVLRFSTSGLRDYFVHENLLNAKCATTAFRFERARSIQSCVTHISNADLDGFPHFLLWLNCGTMGPLGKDPEKSYLAAFRFAHLYGLHEFKDFVSSKFENFAPLHYGDNTHNPSVPNLVYAHEHLDNQNVCLFITEQFVRSWIYRRAYLEEELDWLVDSHPTIAKILFQTVQDVVMHSCRASLASFEWSDSDTPAEDTDEQGGESTTHPGQPDSGNTENQQDGNSQRSCGVSHSTSSIEDFEIVPEEPRDEEPPFDLVPQKDTINCEPLADQYEEAKLEDAAIKPGLEPETEYPQESSKWGVYVDSSLGLGVSKPIAEEVSEIVESGLPMDAAVEPVMAVSENIVPPKKSKKKGNGISKKAKKAKAAKVAMESQL